MGSSPGRDGEIRGPRAVQGDAERGHELLRAVARSARGLPQDPRADHRGWPPLCPLWVAAPLPPCGWPPPFPPWLTRQRDLGVDEVGRVFDRVVKLPAAGSVRSRARSIRPRALRSASLKTGLDTGGIQTPAAGRLLLVQPPPHAANGRRERALSVCADAWLPRPRAAQPNLNPLDTTPIPTEYKRPTSPRSGTLSALALSRPSASGARAQIAENSHR